jgi:hypothetical protein
MNIAQREPLWQENLKTEMGREENGYEPEVDEEDVGPEEEEYRKELQEVEDFADDHRLRCWNEHQPHHQVDYPSCGESKKGADEKKATGWRTFA